MKREINNELDRSCAGQCADLGMLMRRLNWVVSPLNLSILCTGAPTLNRPLRLLPLTL